NHTAEGNHLGPSLSFKGIDNRTYYRLTHDDRRYYFDYTGTGNSLNVRHPQTLRVIMDSLRYWVEEMHVDGFRFDLASTLARSLHEVDKLSSFFTIINQDPVIGQVKLIAEPWDVGEGGYQVGQFPVKWAEWNGKFRDCMRAFWRGDAGRAAELGYRITGSPDLYAASGRSPTASINLITAHDGFTLRDLVSYNTKHNEANQEGNRDGADDNASWNCGVEGDTDDPEVNKLRGRQMRNFLAMLLLSHGTPMLCGGDELGRSQRGNNNAYCQDNELSWIDWNLDENARALLAFTKKLVKVRSDHPLFRRAQFVQGRDVRGTGVSDIAWFRHDGSHMTEADWANPSTASLGMFLSGSGADSHDEQGRPIVDDDLIVLINASAVDLGFVLPPFGERGQTQAWELQLDTYADDARERVTPGAATVLHARSVKVFSRRTLGAGGLMAAYGTPTSTYRLQLHKGFTFANAAEIVDYLAQLGIGGIYASPYLHAEAGSLHGYNVANHGQLNPELGGDEAHRAWTDAMRARGLQHIMDFVPNHVGIGSGENPWWLDVLENGPSSEFAEFFDIDWDPPTTGLRGKVLLPVLSAQFGEELEAGKLKAGRDRGSLFIAYHERRFPASLRSYVSILEAAADLLSLPVTDVSAQDLASIATAIRHLPPPSATTLEDRTERAREKEVIKRRLAALCETSAEVARSVDEALVHANETTAAIERLLLDQNYRLSYWRVATEEINFRRFFDVNELAAIRMEDPRVFDAAHALVFRLLAERRITGLRLDHTDGLYDPQAYFAALQHGVQQALAGGGVQVGAPIYLVAEKILDRDESLPHSWPIAGTTGYDYLGASNGIWVQAAAERELTAVYQRFTGIDVDYRRITYDAKRTIMDSTLSSEIHMLGHSLKRIAERRRRAQDFTLTSLLRAIEETIVAFSVYRTYVRPDGTRREQDETQIRRAVRIAKRNNRIVEPSVFDFLETILLLEDLAPETVWFAMRFQQLTGPIMAKGVEDTALYRFNRLVCLNEVGCDAGQFGTPVSRLHEHHARMLADWPLSMTATTTHDTKRSEDVRARLAVLSEMPSEWETAALQLHEIAHHYVRDVDGELAPSPNDAYLFYQVVVGAFPFEGLADAAARDQFAQRMRGYMVKAVHEAKVRTSWVNPNLAYDRAIADFVSGVLSSEPFVGAVAALAMRLAPYGASNSLSQLAVRLAAPGVPDMYQGCELWDLSLVDPDNRRAVDYVHRRALLRELDERGAPSPDLAAELVRSYTDGRVKLHVVRTALRRRRDDPALFLEGAYRPIDAGRHVVAFERVHGANRLVCIAPRLPFTLTQGTAPWAVGDAWGDATIDVGQHVVMNLFTGEHHQAGEIRLAALLRTFPVAWLAAPP
ncbi:MAG: malto-oligosyltrehalose synthase, partial [Kofleriaceae bacterium]